MKRICIYLLLLFSTSSFGQMNLVPNPSFEDTVLCPHSTNQVDRAVGWYPSRNTPDYFNECDWINGTLSVPDNFCGFQYAHSGVAYCGFCPYSRNDTTYRENFTCQLLSPLIIGKKYLVSFYASHSDLYNRLSCNKLGILFSTIDYNMTNNSPTNNYCQFYTDSIVSDTMNWSLISGTIVADSAYEYLSVGNFFENYLTDTASHPPVPTATYYYIDDISVTEDTTTAIPFFDKNKNIIISPNPFINEVNIYSNKMDILSWKILSLKGELLFGRKCENGTFHFQINLEELSSGIYILELNYCNHSKTNFKLIKS